MRTSAGKNSAPLQSTVHLIKPCFICLCFGTCYAKTKCLIGSVLALKCGLWYVISTFVTILFLSEFLLTMPRKFTRVVRKRYSMKKTDGQATASNQEAVEMVDVGNKQKLMRM